MAAHETGDPGHAPGMDDFYLEMVNGTLRESHDPHKRIACVLSSRDGRTVAAANRMPDGVASDVPGRDVHPGKADWLQHAETRAVALAARLGVPLEGATSYLNWFPCHRCAPVLIDAGIREVVGTLPDFQHHRYGTSFRIAASMSEEAGVRTRVFSCIGGRLPAAA